MFWPICLWALGTLGLFLSLRRWRPAHDPYLVPLLALLTGWGLVVIGRLAPNFLWRQVVWFGLGCGVIGLLALLPTDLRFLHRYRYSWLLLGLALLAATLVLGVNPSGQGAQLWLQAPLLGRVYFQPSELLKVLLIVFLASYFADRGHLLALGDGRLSGRLAYLGPLLLMWGFCLTILIWQRDLGAATLFFGLFLMLLFIATGSWSYTFVGLMLLLLATLAGYFLYDVVALRVDTWWNPWRESSGRGFQIVQSLYALAAGSLLGAGVGQGFPDFIPVVHTDFAFAAIAEEWGLIGGLSVIVLYAILAERSFRIATMNQDRFRLYLAAGIGSLFAIQALLIMGGVTKLIPLTGVTLPFVSYGGSSLLTSCIMVGLLIHLSGNPSGKAGDRGMAPAA
ncbi:MAG: FtsW/RodA/SpoVE family cell cycle protein [Candidatus Promineifilaceae bacterium]